MRILIILWVVFSSLIFSSQTVHAMWGSEAQPIAKEVNSLLRSTTTDGAGGAIISWTIYRGWGPTARLKIQRIDANGDILWQKNGIDVSTSVRAQEGPGVLNDGFGNTIVFWTEAADDIYAQKVDGSGNLIWGSEGIRITNIQSSAQIFSGIVSDGNGGAFIAWVAASGIGTVTFSVMDEYGIIQPSISNFNATIQLEASREGSDEDGRLYTISAVASDAAGNITTTSTTVLVPHDQGN